MVVQPLIHHKKIPDISVKSFKSDGLARYGEVGRRDGEVAAECFVPTWMHKDGIVLRFKGLHMGVKADQDTNQHKFCILYHLSDSTFEVLYDDSECKGKIYLKRYCNTSSLQEWQIPNPLDLDVGKCINILGHTFKILDMTPSTKEYLEAQGRIVTAPCLDEANEIQIPEKCTLPSREGERLTSYLSRGENVSKTIMNGLPLEWKGVILKFWAIDGESKHYLIKYHVEDCSVELFEFLDDSLSTTHKILSRTNFIDPVGSLLKATPAGSPLFKPLDFLVGDHVKICGRKMCVYKVDQVSQEWMASNMNGIDVSRMQEIPIVSTTDKKKAKQRDRNLSHDDESEIVSPAPSGLETMQFLAKLVNPKSDDTSIDEFNSERRFIIQVHCSDFTICIRELSSKGSSGIGGKFLERQRVYTDLAKKRGLLQPSEFYIGSEVKIYGRTFEILDADRSTLEYIAFHPEYFPRADATAILDEVNDALRQIPASVPRDAAFSMLKSSIPNIANAAIVSACIVLGQSQ